MDYKIHTQDGEEVEALFSYRAISARIVNSPLIMGTTNTLLNVLADRMIKVYNGISY